MEHALSLYLHWLLPLGPIGTAPSAGRCDTPGGIQGAAVRAAQGERGRYAALHVPARCCSELEKSKQLLANERIR
jgi:hypothetical protein